MPLITDHELAMFYRRKSIPATLTLNDRDWINQIAFVASTVIN